MKYQELKQLLENEMISSVRVVPIPLSKGWCIDVLIKEVLDVGSRTDTLDTDRSTKRQRKVRRFGSIDSAARLLKDIGVSSFIVDMDDSISFFEADSESEKEPMQKKESAEIAELKEYRQIPNSL